MAVKWLLLLLLLLTKAMLFVRSNWCHWWACCYYVSWAAIRKTTAS